MTQYADMQWTVSEFAKYLKDRPKRNNDNIIALSGFRGSGKSTAEIVLAKALEEDFSISNQLAFTRPQFEGMIESRQNSVIGGDEAINLFFKREFATREQIELLKFIDMCRIRKNTLLLCLPDFWALDKHIRFSINARIHMYERGKGLIFFRSEDPFTADVWYRSYNEKLSMSSDSLVNNAPRMKGFGGYIEFRDLFEYEKEEYNKVSAEGKARQRLEKVERVDADVSREGSLVWKRRVFLALQAWKAKGLLSKDFANVIGMEPNNVDTKSRWKDVANFKNVEKVSC